MLKILPLLTREYVLSFVTQESIFKKFCDIPEIIEGYKFNSPFDINEEDPSFVFKYSGKRLRATDYGGDFYGDCFDLVGRLYGLDSRKKDDFIKILHIIAKEFNLHQYSTTQTIYDPDIYNSIKLSKRSSKLSIEFSPRPFNSNDRTWISIRIPLPKLQKYEIYAIQELYLNNNSFPIYTYNVNDPAYAYVIDKANKEYKIYFPLRKKGNKRRPRFISNTRKIQGLAQIKKSEIGIITKSLKDIVTLNCFKINNLEIESVAPNAESVLITPEEYRFIKSFYGKIYSLMDYDPAGLHMAWLLRKHYEIEPLFLKNPTWNSKIKYPIKDISDLRKHNKDSVIEKLIEETYNKLLK